MSTKKSTIQKPGCRHKKKPPKKEKAEARKNDVLVLPPDLLQKLGINLKNIQSPQQSSLGKKLGACSKFKQCLIKTDVLELDPETKCIPTEEKESSILETANLMKASVFLSPTFSSLKANIILDTESSSETCIEEIVAKSDDNIQSEEQNKHINTKDELIEDNMKHVSIFINNNEKSISVDSIVPVEASVKGFKNDHIGPLKTDMESKCKRNIQSQDEVVFKNCIKKNEKEVSCKNAIVPVSVDIIISNNIENDKKRNESITSSTKHQYHNEKIHQAKDNLVTKKTLWNENLGEEKQDSSSKEHCGKLHEIHNMSKVYCYDKVIKTVEVDLYNNSNNHCSPQDESVELRSSLDKKLKSIKEPNIDNTTTLDNPRIQTITNGNLCLPAMSKCKIDFYNKPSSVINGDNNSNNSYEGLFDTQKKGYKTYSLGICQITNDINTHSRNFDKQTSFYMCEEATNNINTESEVPIGKVTGPKRQYNMTKNIDTTGNSKLCIEGVEKPGGENIKSIHLNRNVKTYSRHRNPKFSNSISGLISCKEYIFNSDIDYKINYQNLYTGTESLHNFCLCKDFGCFLNYDVDNSYDHIHFRERKGAQCSVETLLSIYEDNHFEHKYKRDNMNIHEDVEIDKECQLETPDDSVMGICWNYTANIICEKGNHELINQQNINDNIEYFVNKNEQCENVEMALNKGKRKITDKTSESETDCEKPRTKKAKIAVKCGVCSCQVYKNEWDSHISKEHCFIAWREGQEMDFKNKELLKKIEERLYKTDKLECTFCEIELYDVKKFIKHVCKCKERKYPEKATNITEHSKIDVVMPTFEVEYEKTEVPALNIKSKIKLVTNKGKLQTIKQNPEDQVETVKKTVFKVQNDESHLEPILQTVKQVTNVTDFEAKTGQRQVMKIPVLQRETKQKYIVETPILHVEIGEKQVLEAPVLLEHFAEIQAAEVPENQVTKGPVPQVKMEEKQAVHAIQIETDEKQEPDEPVLQGIIREKPVPQVAVLQVETGDKNVTCGVCNEVVCYSAWVEHITQKHNYIAWKDDEPPLDYENEDEIRNYLNYIIKEIGELVCKGCGLKRKFAKSYLKHIKNCQNTEQLGEQVVDKVLTPENTENIKKVKAKPLKNPEIDNMSIKCGVCKLKLTNAQWMHHIFEEHDYLAWKEGDPEIDVNDSQQVHDHLFNITKQNDGLTCKKCGLHRRYVKTYLKHVENCDSGTNDSLIESTVENTVVDALIVDLSNEEDAKCGVCKMDVEGKHWFSHVHLCHAYLAWKEGKTPLDLNNEEEVQCYLYLISKTYNGLICNKCGLNRKYVKVYLSHFESCNSKLLDSTMIVDGISNKDSYECAVCAKKVDSKDWNNHSMKLHYNMAWVVGDFPIDTKNISVVEKQLKACKKERGKLKCNICGATRVSPMGFYAHIIQCGKTEEEIDVYKIFCELCNSKYLCIYKSQHAIMHRELQFKERRKEIAQETESMHSVKTVQLSERRQAAEKARQFIEKSETFAFNCSECGYGADDQVELDEHICAKVYKAYIDSEDSAELGSSDDESADSAVDSNLSDEEIWPGRGRRKWHGDSGSAATKVPRIPFTVKCAKSFLKQSADDYRNIFLTNGTLYPQWRCCSIELLADDQTTIYLPPLKESCKVIIGRSSPVTYNQFEAKKQNGYSVFVGGCIQCISWAPPHVDDSDDEFGHFLAVALHNDVDSPRLDCAKTYEYSGLLQIWDFGNLSNTYPKFALGIAHDYGTIWAIDWCPSGTRDVLSPSGRDKEPETVLDKFLRLGLLAIACSNGSAYIYSVPYPSSVKTSDKDIYKFTPVAELRLSRGKRVVFQATSISWSRQNGHETIVVGYSNGTVASYSLDCNSPLLTANEGGVNIFYPFQDERPHSSSITDVKTFPSSVGAGLMSSVSPTGSEAAQQRGLARIHKHLSSSSAAFAPHWPALMLSGNEVVVNQTVNELDFWGVGRRTGAVQKCCGCLHCGHMATFVPPVMKILTTHPAYIDFQKEPLAVIQMRPLTRKRSKQKNDLLQLRLEPLTYGDAVKYYALDFKLMKDLDKETIRQINRPRTQHPERFPLSDVPSMAFYPSQKHHRKLAVATHAGIIFILTDDITL